MAGLGTHGGAEGNVRWLVEQGANVTITDLRQADELREVINRLRDLPQITWVLGEHRPADFTMTDMVLRNPALPVASPYLSAARAARVPIEMDSSLFLKLCSSGTIFGVIGNKHKRLTTLGIEHLLHLTFARVVMIGIGNGSPLAALSEVGAEDLVVFELNSARLEGLREAKLSPQTSVITHLTGGSATELEVKKSALQYQASTDRVLLNYDDPGTRAWRANTLGQVFWYSLGKAIPGNGICVRRGQVTIVMNYSHLSLFRLNTLGIADETQQRELLPAIFLAFASGARPSSIALQVRHLTNVAHRLEPIAEIGGVRYLDDSAATIPEATVAALSSLNHKHIVLVLGGSDTTLSFEKLAQACANSWIRALVFIPGSTTGRMREVIESRYQTSPPIHMSDSVPEAVRAAARYARPGDTVLFSPAASTTGYFRDEFQRGQLFAQTVTNLQELSLTPAY